MTTITDSELLLYKSNTVTNTGANGGRMSSNAVPTNTRGAVFPAVTSTERAAGLTRFRKLFWKVAHAGEVDFQTTRVWLAQTTPGGSRVTLQSASQRDTDANLTGNERRYGCGTLHADISAGATSLQVNVEAGGGAELLFQAGDTVWIGDGTNEEFVTIANGGVSWSTDRATLTLTAGTVNAYATLTPTYVASCLSTASVVASCDPPTATGDFTWDGAETSPIVCDGIGTIEQDWTLTFTSPTAFTVLGDTVGSLGAGTIGTNFAPNNSAFAVPYFTLPAAGWGGTPEAGDTLEFTTHPAAVPCRLRLVVPAGAAAAADGSNVRFYGESA